MGATGVIRGNLVFTDARAGKADPFIANDLTHCVDDHIDVLTSIRACCWALAPPPHQFVPGAHAVGGRNLVKFRALLLNGRSRNV